MNKKALESFLNSEVIAYTPSIFEWRRFLYYQCIPYTSVLHYKKYKASHFIKYEFNGKVYGIREVSEKLLTKLLS